MKQSKFLSLSVQDWLKGLLMAFLTAVATPFMAYLETGGNILTFDWRKALISGVSVGILYLLKNLFTNSNGQTGKTE